MEERPTGVTVLAILDIVGGALLLLLGLTLTVLGPTVLLPFLLKAHARLPPAFVAAIGILGLIFIVPGIISIVIGWGLLKGKGWSWWLTVIFAVLGIIGSAINLVIGNIGGIVGLIIEGIILYYMTRPHVKEYFVMY